MKALHLLPPILALVASAAWLSSQQVRLIDLEKQTKVMRERIATFKALPAEIRTERSFVKEEDSLQKFLLEDGSFDWVMIAKMMGQSQTNGVPLDMKAFFKIQEMILEMSVPELEEAFVTIEGLPLSNEMKQGLQSHLMGVFVQKDPVATLKRFQSKLRDPNGQMSWHLRSAFESWMKKDQGAAMAWFDARKKTGAFDNKSLGPSSSMGRAFEVRLLGELMKSDPEAVRDRLAKLPDEERKSVITSAAMINQGRGMSEDYLALIRDSLPKEERYEVLANAIGQQVYSGNLPTLSEQFKGVILEPAERMAIIEKVVENFARPWNRKPADLVEVYDWAEKEASGRAAELTGKTFAKFAGHRNTDFQETFQEVMKAAEDRDKPEILDHFATSLEDPQRHLEKLNDEGLKTIYQDLLSQIESPSGQ